MTKKDAIRILIDHACENIAGVGQGVGRAMNEDKKRVCVKAVRIAWKMVNGVEMTDSDFFNRGVSAPAQVNERCPGSWPIKEGGVVYCAQPRGHEGPCAPPKPRTAGTPS